jgi:hypothetical protein
MHSPGIAVTSVRDGLTVDAGTYTWSWSSERGEFLVEDPQGRPIAHGSMQPGISVARASDGAELCVLGELSSVETAGNVATFTFDGVNGDGRVVASIEFYSDYLIQRPPLYSANTASNVETVLLFAECSEGAVVPAMRADYYVHPGSTESSVIGPVIPAKMRINITSTIGRGSNDEDSFASQQWALPSYFYGGYSLKGWASEKGALVNNVSDAFCAGLIDLPTGDLYLRHHGEKMSPFLRLFGARWHTHDPSVETLSLGSAFLWVFAANYRDAIREYYLTLDRIGMISTQRHSDRKNAVITMSQFNTWGAQVAGGVASAALSQESLEQIYDDFRSSGMNSQMFVIDDRWEGEYGRLSHDPIRFPGFEAFLARVRADGHAIGMWAAFMRCQDPESMGLTSSDMLADPDGVPVKRSLFEDHYYLFDVSVPRVREVLADKAREFVRRYDPDLVKFDFGYELPSMKYAAPADRSWGGEVLLLKALELVIAAMREVKPDVAVMYYNLTPLLNKFIDQHSTDDLYLNAGEYDSEVNRRIFFTSLLSDIGVPTYGSGGYDWIGVKDIWFDTVASGPLGSLNSFRGDQSDSSPSPEDSARYRGLSRLTRRGDQVATVLALEPRLHGGSTTAHARSWVRMENGAATIVALRTSLVDGRIRAAHFEELVSTTGSVVVGSLDRAGVATSRHLGIVPCGVGEVRIAIAAFRAVTVTIHTLNRSFEGSAAMVGGELVMRFDDHTPTGIPIDWIELRFD